VRRAPRPGLLGPLGVDDHRAGDGDEVDLPARHRALRELRQANSPGGDHGHVDTLLHGLGQRERKSLVPARVLDVRAAHPGGDRQVVDRGSFLERVDDLERVVERQAVGALLVGAQPHAEREVGAAPGPYLLHELAQHPHSSVERVAAVRVRSPVRRP
jgi:hypothetical protein